MFWRVVKWPYPLSYCVRDVGQHMHLLARQGAVGHRNAQHVGMELQIDTIHQAERLELIFGNLASQAAFHLSVELGYPFFDKRVVEFVVAIPLTCFQTRVRRKLLACRDQG